MKHIGARNKGVDFLLQNLESRMFQQTMLGFNTVTRMVLGEQENVLEVFFESDDFENWMKATDKELKTMLEEKFGDKLVNMSDRGFDLKYKVPDGLTEEIKDEVAKLRDTVYICTFSHLLTKSKSQGRSYDYKKSTKVRVNNKCEVYIGKSDKATLAHICFKESENRMEQELLRVYIEEFATARKGPGLNAAPSVAARKEKGYQILEVAYSQNLLQKNLARGAQLIYQVPDDLDYHMKASKTYFHHNMHVQVANWLQTLKRADPNAGTGKAAKQRKGLKNR